MRPDSGETGAVPGCLIRLSGGSDVLGGAVGGRGAGLDLGWWFEQAEKPMAQSRDHDSETRERAHVQDAIDGLLTGQRLRSTGGLTVVQLAAEAGVKRWHLTLSTQT